MGFRDPKRAVRPATAAQRTAPVDCHLADEENFIKHLASEVPQRGGFSMDMAVVFEWFGQIRAAEQAHEPRQREIWTRWAMLWGGSP